MIAFRRALRQICLVLTVSLLAACGGGGGDSTPVDPATQPTRDTSLRIQSTGNQVNYPIHVYLPPGYATSTKTYPVLYTMDAEWSFLPLSTELFEQHKEVIVISIGNSDGQATGQRWIDYQMPGAAAHYRFLTQQVIPYVEARYRIDPTRRTLIGHSMGGLFAGLVLLLEDPAHRYFANYISQDGSFWVQEDVVAGLEAALAQRTQSVPARLFIFSASQGDGNLSTVEPFRDLFVARNYQNLVYSYEAFPTTHSGMVIPSFRRAIAELYP
ncbi:alpha/beta hydrolase [Niveibacterium sp.]|uniref:alpha/beta hydrolase n=1 Tax=Niveibacterium sp. TaxID=2017444 RepID=UPI0035B01084